MFCLLAALAYLRFDQTREKAPYVLAAVLFVLGLMSKTAIATLPAAMLVMLWWKRGTLSLRRDGPPLLPLLILGLGSGIATAAVERGFLGTERQEFNLTLAERFLIAGRALWFYLGKLFWPRDLLLIYPRWTIAPHIWWQWLFPASFLALVGVLWAVRHRWRGPLAAALLFAGTLLPALGFVNMYTLVYTFVADHYQYLASLSVIALVAAVAIQLAQAGATKLQGAVMALVLLGSLAVLTWRQSRLYSNVELLYRTTIDHNPGCWLAYNNLGLELGRAGRSSEAIEDFQQALNLQPDYVLAHLNLGAVLADAGQIDAGIEHFKQAIRLDPGRAEGHYDLGRTLAARG